MKKLPLAFFAALAFSGAALAEDFVFLAKDSVDLARLLPPPPAAESEAQKRDLEAVLQVQRTRTPQLAKRATADNELSIFRIMEPLGPNVTGERLPVTAAFFKKVHADARNIINASKDAWNRPRPF